MTPTDTHHTTPDAHASVGNRIRETFFALLIVVAVSASLFAAQANAPERDPFRAAAIDEEAAPFTSLTYGIQAFAWWDTGLVGLHLDWVKLMSFTHVKQVFAWHDIEPQPDEWHFGPGDRLLDAIEARDLALVARLSDAPYWSHPSLQDRDEAGYVDAPPDPDYLDDWADYCGTVAARYAGRIAAYQIWNEPNLHREWGYMPPDPAYYVEMLAACSEAIRAADPEAVIISAGLAPTGEHSDRVHRDDIYLDAMYRAGFQQYVDAVGVHAPGYNVPDYGPDDAERDGFGRWASFRRVEDLRKIMIEYGDAARQMAILEMGYTTDPRPNSGYDWFAVSEEEQAVRLEAAFAYIAEHWRPWVGLVSAIYIPKPTWTPDDEQYWWSITDPEMEEVRPAFQALGRMPKYCGDVVIPPRGFEEAAFALADNPCN